MKEEFIKQKQPRPRASDLNPDNFSVDNQEVMEWYNDVVNYLENGPLKGRTPLSLFEKRDLKKWVKECLIRNKYLEAKIKIFRSRKNKRAMGDHRENPTSFAYLMFFNYYGLDFQEYIDLYGDSEQTDQRFYNDLDFIRRQMHSL